MARRTYHFWWVLVTLLPSILSTHVNAQGSDLSKRTKLDPFRISFGPLVQEPTYQEQLLVRYEVEQILSSYLKAVWPTTTTEPPTSTSVIFVAVPRILAFAATGENNAEEEATLTLDGVVYYSDASTLIPTPEDLVPYVAAALNEVSVLPALQKHFPTVTTVSSGQSPTPPPTATPTSSPTGAPTTQTPTNAPTTLAPTAPPTYIPTFVPTPGVSTTSPTSQTTTTAPVEVVTSPAPVVASPAPVAPPTLNPNLSLTAAPVIEPDAFPTLAPVITTTTIAPSLGVTTMEPTTSAPTVVEDDETRPPQAIIGVSRDVNTPLDDDSSISGGAIAGAAAGALLVLLGISMFISHHRKRSRTKQLGIVLDESQSQEEDADFVADIANEDSNSNPNKGSPTRTCVNSSMDEDEEIVFSHNDKTTKNEETSNMMDSTIHHEETKKPHGLWNSMFRGKEKGQQAPNLAMTDCSGNEDNDEERSEAVSQTGTDHGSLADLYRSFWPRARSPGTLPDSSSGGQSVSGQSIESFEQQRRQQHSHVIRKDLLESPDFSASALRDMKTGQVWVHEEQYDCALAPTDISAATLAQDQQIAAPVASTDLENQGSLLTADEDDDDHTMDTKTTIDEPTLREEIQDEAKRFKNSVSTILGAFLGGRKPSSRPQRSARHPSELQGEDLVSACTADDDDTFGQATGDWDPDDDDDESGSHNDVFAGLNRSASGSIDEQSLMEHRERSNEKTYQLQRLRTPPPAPAPNNASPSPQRKINTTSPQRNVKDFSPNRKPPPSPSRTSRLGIKPIQLFSPSKVKAPVKDASTHEAGEERSL